MKSTIRRFAAFCLLSALVAFASQPVRASSVASVPITSATEAVFYAQGALDVQPLIADALTLATSGLPHLPFRQMAGIQRELARQFAASPIMVAYLVGRADALEAAADVLGEL